MSAIKVTGWQTASNCCCWVLLLSELPLLLATRRCVATVRLPQLALPPSPSPTSFSEARCSCHTIAWHFFFHVLLCWTCTSQHVTGEEWATFLGPGRTGSAGKAASVGWWWTCAAAHPERSTLYLSVLVSAKRCWLFCSWGISLPWSTMCWLSQVASREVCVWMFQSTRLYPVLAERAGELRTQESWPGLPTGDCHSLTAGSWAGFLSSENTAFD